MLNEIASALGVESIHIGEGKLVLTLRYEGRLISMLYLISRPSVVEILRGDIDVTYIPLLDALHMILKAKR